jgi:uncharacterized protein YbaP (TraB family)
MYYEIEGTCTRLAGSLHLVPADAPTLPDWVWSAYQWAETITFEHDAALAKDYVLLGDGKSLESHLPMALWNRLVASWPTDRPLANISSLKLWMAIPILPLSQIAAAPGVEPQLTLRARQEGKSITYLETMAEFAELADAIPREALNEALSVTLAELKRAPRNFLDLHQAWRNRDLDQVARVVAQTPFHRMPEIAARMIGLRNERWLSPILAATFSGKRTLIAAGALHLLGKTGLLALL